MLLILFSILARNDSNFSLTWSVLGTVVAVALLSTGEDVCLVKL